MQTRPLHVAAYDIRDPKRLRKGLEVLKSYATGGQKSVFECFLSTAEKAQMIAEVRRVLDQRDDSFFLVRLDPRSKIRTLGVAVAPEDPPFFYIG